MQCGELDESESLQFIRDNTTKRRRMEEMKHYTSTILKTEDGIILKTCERTASGERKPFDVVMGDEAETELKLKNRKIAILQNLTDERNMISDLIMDDMAAWFECVMGMHDAHSFWDLVRKAHAEIKEKI